MSSIEVDADGDGPMATAELAKLILPAAPVADWTLRHPAQELGLDFKDAADEPGSVLSAKAMDRDQPHGDRHYDRLLREAGRSREPGNEPAVRGWPCRVGADADGDADDPAAAPLNHSRNFPLSPARGRGERTQMFIGRM